MIDIEQRGLEMKVRMDSPLLVGEEGDESIFLSIFNTDIVRQVLDGSHEMSSGNISTLNDLVEFQAKAWTARCRPNCPKGSFWVRN